MSELNDETWSVNETSISSIQPSPLPITTTTGTNDEEDFLEENGDETLKIIVAVSISVTLTLLLFLILMLVVLYRKRLDCFPCSSSSNSKSSKASTGSVDDINISTIGRYYDILKSPIRKFSLSVLSDRKSSNASRKLSESSQVPESSELPRRNQINYLSSHLCPPSQSFTPRSLGEEEIKPFEEETQRYGDHIVIPHIIESDVDRPRYSPRLDHLRLLTHSAPNPIHNRDADEESLDSPFSRTPRLDDREAIFGKPEKQERVSDFQQEINNMRDIDESSEDMRDESFSSYTGIQRQHFGQSMEALSPSMPKKCFDRNSYNPTNQTFDATKQPSMMSNTVHHSFRSEGWLLDYPSVPPKITPRLPPKQAINKSKDEIQVISQELLASSSKALNNSEYEDYDNPPSYGNEFEDYDIPADPRSPRGLTKE